MSRSSQVIESSHSSTRRRERQYQQACCTRGSLHDSRSEWGQPKAAGKETHEASRPSMEHLSTSAQDSDVVQVPLPTNLQPFATST